MDGMSPPLKGLLFAVSVAVQEAVYVPPVQFEVTAFSYNSLKDRIIALGGRISSTVHKNVDYLVATETSVQQCTQRVRKAAKIGIPVLKTSFLQTCEDTKTMESMLFEQTYITSCIEKYEERFRDNQSLLAGDETKLKKRPRKSDADIRLQALCGGSDVTYECGCICHDTGAESCSFCIGAHTLSQDLQTYNHEQQKNRKKGEKKRKRKCESQEI